MPNRILKESICTSETIDALSTEAEAFFYRLMVQCDDFGRMDARASVIRARCYPLRLDKVTDKLVTRWLAELVAADLIWVYEVDGRPYLQVTTWDKHQQKRAKYSKFPQPPERDSNCNQVLSDDSNSPREYENTRNENRDTAGQNPPAPPEPGESDPVKDLAAVFEQAAGVKLPEPSGEKAKKTVGVTWWHPLREMVKLANGNSEHLLRTSIKQLRDRGLNVSSPQSCLKTFTSLHGAAVTGATASLAAQYRAAGYTDANGNPV